MSEQGLRFSVVVPAYNEADYLGASLRSLQRQDFGGRYEIIVVDNGSSDRTVTVAEAAGVLVLHEPQPGVCAARQCGVESARGEYVVSTDADTVHPIDWLSRIDAQFRSHPEAVAVAGPCRYLDPPWWAGVFPPVWFRAIATVHSLTGRVTYLTATNVAYARAGFPGYDITLTQGGDEVDLLRRIRRMGRIHWDRHNSVDTSSRRMDQGLPHTLIVSYGYYYLFSHLVNRITGHRVIGVAPAIRTNDRPAVARRRRRWHLSAVTVLVGLAMFEVRRRHRGKKG